MLNPLRTAFSIAAAFALIGISNSSVAQVAIGVNFNRNTDEVFDDTEIAGAVPRGFWNQGTPNNTGAVNETILNLVDSNGNDTTADITFSGPNMWAQGGTGDGNVSLLKGYIDDGGSGGLVEFTDIPYSTYDLYLYGIGDGAVGTFLSGYTVTSGASVIDADWLKAAAPASGGALIEGSSGVEGHYFKIEGLTSTDLTITNVRPTGGRSPLAGVQIVDPNGAFLDPALKIVVDRDTGNVTLVNNTGEPISLAGLGLLSGNGVWDAAAWTSISGNYDEGGDLSADEWLEFSRSSTDLSEGTLGAAAIADGQSVSLGTGLWTPYPDETDLALEYLDADTLETINGVIEFTDSDPSNGDSPYAFGDYDFDGDIDPADWEVQRSNFRQDLTGLSVAAAYAQGDFDGDLDNDLDDLLAFKSVFLAANPGASLDGFSVPEPMAISFFLLAGVLAGLGRWGSGRRPVGLLVLGLLFAAPLASDATADSLSINFIGNGASVTGPAGVTGSSNWNNFAGNSGLAALIDQDGNQTGAGVTWASHTTWGNGPTGTENEKLLSGYLDDNGPAGLDVLFSGIPATTYDVTIYLNDDTSRGVDNVFDIDVNGVNYTTTGQFVPPQSGTFDATNTITVTGLSGPLSLFSGQRTLPGITSVSGVEIVADSFLSAAETALTLEVDATTGGMQIRNTSLVGDIAFDYFEVAAGNNELSPSGWAALDGSGNNADGWEVLGGASDSFLAQFNLTGEALLLGDQAAYLGVAYDTGVGEQPLTFQYRDARTGLLRAGNVSFTTVEPPVGLAGDYNGDGAVNAADYTVWRDNLNSPEDDQVLSGNGDGSGTVDQGDYDRWRQNYGQTASSPEAAGTSAPEPSTLAVLAVLVGALTLIRQRPTGAFRMNWNTRALRAATLATGLAVVVFNQADAAVTLDRDYTFGGDSLEFAAQGATVGSSNTSPLGAGQSADGTGPSGAFLDLSIEGAPKYENVSASGLNRPQAGSGQDGFGVRFDGANDLLTGFPLNRPDELADIVNASGPSTPFPLNYDGITTRGMQLWVYPEQAGIDSGEYQSIVTDTIITGGPAINELGQWTQTNSYHSLNNGVPASVGVVGNTWYHVMHHVYDDSAPNAPTVVPGSGGALAFTAVVYVDGIAVSVNNDTADLGGSSSQIDQLVVGGAEIDGDGLTPVYGNYFTGVVDDLEMYVYGDNTAQGGQDYGDFDLFADNAWIKDQIDNDPVLQGVLTPGDANRDGVVNGTGLGPESSDDVSLFIANWRRSKVFAGAHNTTTAGDWETWGWGDFDHDGSVNFTDWAILRANHPDGTSLSLGALLSGSAVPEPCGLLLMGIAFGCCAGSRRRS